MNKTEKAVNNSIIEKEWEKAKQEIDHKCGTRLRTCTAWVYETKDYYFLRSYNTTVAFIDKATDICYDVLRLVYGYTSTSAHHISKFDKDYGQGKWGCKERKTWIP